MATTNLGKVSVTPKGEYDPLITYERLDIISHNGSSYIVKQASTGVTPIEGEFYALIAEKGDGGSFVKKAYKTYAAMDADKVNIPANSSVDVTNDLDESKNGAYIYDGVAFTRSQYDSKVVTDKIIADTAIAVQDAINNTAIEGGVLADTFVTTTANAVGSIPRTLREKLSENVSVMDFGALGDDSGATIANWLVVGSRVHYPNLAAIKADYPHVTRIEDTIDWVAIQAAVNYVESKGGGRVNLPANKYVTDDVIRLKPAVDFVGESQVCDIRKISDYSSVAGINSILYGASYRYATLENITLIGNRTDYAAGNVVNMRGLHLDGGHYLDIRNVRANSCLNGFYATDCWLIRMSGTMAVTCQGYGVIIIGGNTSFTVTNHTNWGTGGGYSIKTSQYTTIISAANDYIDYGGLPADPFLPHGSGGNILQPNCVFDIVGSQVSIVSVGMENSATQFMRCEGSNVTITNPTVYTTVCHADAYTYIDIVGTAKSTVNIIGADRLFTGLTLDPSLTVDYRRKIISVESAGEGRQIFTSDTLPSDYSGFGEYTISDAVGKYSDPSVICSVKREYVNLTQNTMHVGGTNPFISTGEFATANISLVNDKKVLTLSGDGSTHRIPLQSKSGTFMTSMMANVVGAGDYVKVRIVDSLGEVKSEWQNSGGTISMGYATKLIASSNPLFFEFKPLTGQSIAIEYLNIQQVG